VGTPLIMRKTSPVLLVALAGIVAIAGCGGGDDEPAANARTTAVAAPTYRLALTALRQTITRGRTVVLRARIGGVAGGAIPVELWSYVPGHPDAARRVASKTATGHAAFTVRPDRTLAYELRADHGRQHSSPELIGVNLPGRLQAGLISAGRARFTLRLRAPSGARPNRAARVFLYIAPAGGGAVRMLPSTRLRLVAPGDIRATWTARVAHPNNRDRFYSCAREPFVVGFGLSDARDTRCGNADRTVTDIRDAIAGRN
jgi:hypothetical protein